MLDDSKKQASFIAQLFDALFHLPTLLVLTGISVVLVWQLYGLSLTIGEMFPNKSNKKIGRRFSQINADKNIKNLSDLRLSASYKSVGCHFLIQEQVYFLEF